MCDIITFTLYDCTSGRKSENGLLFVSITNDANTYAKIDTMVKTLDSGFPFREEATARFLILYFVVRKRLFMTIAY